MLEPTLQTPHVTQKGRWATAGNDDPAYMRP